MTTLNSNWQTLASSEHYASGWLALTLKLQARLNEQKTSTNQSVIDTRIYAEITNGGSYSYNSYKYTCSYATDQSGNYANPIVLNSSKTLIQGRGTVTHNSSGAYSGSISGSVWMSNGLSSTLSGNFDLPNISNSTPAPGSAAISGYQNGSTVAIGENVYINWLSVTGANSYDIEIRQPDGSWGGTKNVKVGNQPVTIGEEYMSGAVLEARIRAIINGVASTWTITRNDVTVSGGLSTKLSGTWRKGNTWVKISGAWKRAKRVWVKVDGEWKVSI